MYPRTFTTPHKRSKGSLRPSISIPQNKYIIKKKSTVHGLGIFAKINIPKSTRIIEYIGEKITKADADFVREVTGFAIGGIPPIGHKQVIQTFIDEDLLKHQELWAAAGTPNAVFSLRPEDLQLLTNGTIITIHTKD